LILLEGSFEFEPRRLIFKSNMESDRVVELKNILSEEDLLKGIHQLIVLDLRRPLFLESLSCWVAREEARWLIWKKAWVICSESFVYH
jgi:hypothetical protein